MIDESTSRYHGSRRLGLMLDQLFGIRRIHERQIASRKVLGYTFSAINTWETILTPSAGGQLAITHAIALSTSNNETVRLAEDGVAFVWTDVSTGNPAPLIEAGVGLEIDGDLSAQVTSLDVKLSIWALEIEV